MGRRPRCYHSRARGAPGGPDVHSPRLCRIITRDPVARGACMKLAVLGVVALVAPPVPGADHDAAEKALKRFFEGHSVAVRLDMPATSSGADVYPGRADPLDFRKLGD